MHIDIVPNRNSKPAVLLRESFRDAKRKPLQGIAQLQTPSGRSTPFDGFSREKNSSLSRTSSNGSRLHGGVEAVLSAMKFDKLVAHANVWWWLWWPPAYSKPSRGWQRAVISTTLPEILGVSDADEGPIRRGLWSAKGLLSWRRVTSKTGTWFVRFELELLRGRKCPLARLGYNRDGKKNKLQVNYGLLTNQRGVPVSVSVFEGNTGDPKTRNKGARAVRWPETPCDPLANPQRRGAADGAV